MRRCLDENDVSSLHDATSLLVLDPVGFALLTTVPYRLFPGRGVELSGALDVHKGSGSDDARMREGDFLALKHLEVRLHL